MQDDLKELIGYRIEQAHQTVKELELLIEKDEQRIKTINQIFKYFDRY